MTFYGIDPVGLADLGTTLERHADTISVAASQAMTPLERHDRGHRADRLGTDLTRTARTLRNYAGDFGWRIEAVLRQDHAPPVIHRVEDIPLNATHLAVAVPVGSGPPLLTASLRRDEIERLPEMSPAEVAAYFVGKSEEAIDLLIATAPELVTDLDGAPPQARYVASDMLIGRRIAELTDQAAEARRWLAEEDLQWFQEQILTAHLDVINGEVAELELWLAEDRQILLFDASGDGRVVEVFGDLANSENIGVVVPGITNDRSNFSDGTGGFRTSALNIHTRAGELAVGDVATIAWLGYDTPDGADAVLRRAANQGHGDLIDFVDGLDSLDGHRHITVIGHSYGSLVTGMAAREGLAANEVVFVGSPGTSLGHADEAQLKPGGVVWAGLAHADPIGAGVDITEFVTPLQQFEQSVGMMLDSLSGELAVKDLHHGTNPAHEDFGALEIHTDGSHGHSEYFKPDTVTLDNLLYIIAGMDARVTIEIPDEMEMAPGPIGEPLGPVA